MKKTLFIVFVILLFVSSCSRHDVYVDEIKITERTMNISMSSMEQYVNMIERRPLKTKSANSIIPYVKYGDTLFYIVNKDEGGGIYYQQIKELKQFWLKVNKVCLIYLC